MRDEADHGRPHDGGDKLAWLADPQEKKIIENTESLPLIYSNGETIWVIIVIYYTMHVQMYTV